MEQNEWAEMRILRNEFDCQNDVHITQAKENEPFLGIEKENEKSWDRNKNTTEKKMKMKPKI